MAQGSRQYECIVFGATGYTGKYTAEHITTHLPADFRWAVAGRSESKLKALVDELKSMNADRQPPNIEVAQLDKHDLVNLAKKTKILITTVGPYHLCGTPVMDACAETGTHYLDVSGEVPWVYDMVHKYHETAKKNGAIVIPQNGIESAPTDLMCWMLVNFIREQLNVGTKEVVHNCHEFQASASGGTLATMLSLFDAYSLSYFAKASEPWSMCPVTPPKQASQKSVFEKITGVRFVERLGTLTDSIQGPADIPIVHRSWGLYDEGRYYGENFHLSTYMTARNSLTGFAWHVGLTSAFLSLVLPPTRWLLRRFVYEPGDGPTKE